MYREKPSEPMIDAETGATFVALPFLHFKDMHEFDITLDEKVIRFSCHKIFDIEFRLNAHVFGDPEIASENTPIFAVSSIHVRHQSIMEMEMSGPDRKAAFEEFLPLFGRMLLRFEDCSALFVKPSFHEDYFKSFADLQAEALKHQLEWAHTYILQSRMMMKRFDLDTLAKVRAKFKLNREPGEDEYDYEDRIEEVIEGFAPGSYFLWSNWAEETVDGVIEGVLDLLSCEARTRNMETFLFANLLDLGVDLPEQKDYVSPRFIALRPELLMISQSSE